MNRESLVQVFGVIIMLATILATIFAVLHIITG